MIKKKKQKRAEKHTMKSEFIPHFWLHLFFFLERKETISYIFFQRQSMHLQTCMPGVCVYMHVNIYIINIHAIICAVLYFDLVNKRSWRLFWLSIINIYFIFKITKIFPFVISLYANRTFPLFSIMSGLDTHF